MTILQVRLATLLVGILGCVWAVRSHRRLLTIVKEFFFEPSHPVNLGLLRILIFTHLFDRATRHDIDWYVTLPSKLARLPAGWGWTRSFLPFTNVDVMGAVKIAMIVASPLAILGIATRFSTVVAALSSVLVLAVPNFYFKVNHGAHLATLCSLVLAASACGDALSVDALWRRRRGLTTPVAATCYAIPLRFCWLLLGTTYLGPGLWKLCVSGDLWLNGQRMSAALVRKLATLPEFVPTFNLIGHSTLLAILGTATLIFEVGLFFLIFRRRTRIVSAAVALGFHLGVWMTMGIHFPLTLPLMLLLDFPQVLEVTPRLKTKLAPLRAGFERLLLSLPGSTAKTPSQPLVRGPAAAAFLVGAVLTLSMIVAFLPPAVDSFPVAVYPRFHQRNLSVPRIGSRFQYSIVSPDGGEQLLGYNIGHFDANRSRRFVKRLMSAKRKKGKKEWRIRIGQLIHMLTTAGLSFNPDDRLVVYQATFPVDPAKRTPQTRKRKKILTTPLAL